MIKGGYYIKARIIQESMIAHAAPCVREIWDYLLREANYETNKVAERGTLIRRINDIQEALHWFVGYRKMQYSNDQCEAAVKWLTKQEMTTVTKTVRGLVITICNYDVYQNQKNYEAGSETGNAPAITRQPPGTINNKGRKKEEKNIGATALLPTLDVKTELDEQFVKFNQWLKDNAPAVLKMKQPVTVQQYSQLRTEFNTPELKKLLFQMFEAMDNWSKLGSKASAFKTVRVWAKKEIIVNPSLYEIKSNEPGKSEQRSSREAEGEAILRVV